MERIQDGAFAALTLARVELAENPLRCDCALAWLLDWAEVALARARCDQPASLHGLLVSRCMRSGDLCLLFAHAQWRLLFSVCACEVGIVVFYSRIRSKEVVFCLCMRSKDCCFLFAHAQ